MRSVHVTYEKESVGFGQAFVKQASKAKNMVEKFGALDAEQVKDQIATIREDLKGMVVETSLNLSKYNEMAQTYVGMNTDNTDRDDRNEHESSQRAGVRDEVEEIFPIVDYSSKEVSYDWEKTVLFQLIEDKEWDLVHLRLKSHPEEASTWVYRRDARNPRKISWRMLPIHRVCYPEYFYNADGNKIPCGIVGNMFILEELAKVYPESVKMTDDEGKLPLLLCCRNGSSFHIINYLLDAFPQGIEHLDNKERDCFKLVTKSDSMNKDKILDGLTNFMRERRKEYGGIFIRDE